MDKPRVDRPSAQSNKPFKLKRAWLRLLLILLTVGGGYSGFASSVQLVGEAKNQGSSRLILALIFLGMYAFVTVSGLLLVQDPKRSRPVLISLAFQLPWISSPMFVYQFAAGLHAAITFGTPDGTVGLRLGWNLSLGSHFRFRFWNYQDLPWNIGINAVPLLLSVFLLRSSTRDRSTRN